MRLHHLQVTAFGPFPGTEQVDFDALNEAGLFLLTGATGAGKTSILDAVCFALYGTVPGVRGVKALKSQHADQLTRPEVVLDFSVRDRRFVVRRSPEWTRPKKRGTGTRTEPAAASLLERHGEEELFLTSRAAEVGLLVSDLVGMQAVQFQQVAMLPQGAFQRFLLAGTHERHDVLQHLFRTDRFAQIETWVADHSRDLRDRSATLQQEVQRVVDAVAERAGVDLPEELQPPVLPAAAATGLPLNWADELVVAARTTLQQAAERHRLAEAGLTGARTRLEAVRLRARLRERRRAALAEQAALAASRDEADAARAALDADARASACVPVLRLLDAADRAAREARRRCPAAPDELDPQDLERAVRDAEAQLTRLRDLLPRAERLVVDARDLETIEREVAALADEQAAWAAAAEALPPRRDALRADQERLTATAARREALRLQLAEAQARLGAAEQVPAARRALAGAEETARATRDAAADARETAQDLTERRLAGMAAELAGDLTDGEPCAVCGSPDHPEPARRGPAAVSAEEQRAAQAAYEDARQQHADAVQSASHARRRLQDLLARATRPGDAAAPDPATLTTLDDPAADTRTIDAARTTHADLSAQADEAERAAAAAARAADRLRALEEQLADGQARAGDLAAALATARERVESRRAALTEARAAIATVVGEDTDPATLPLLEQRLADQLRTLTRRAAAVADLERAEERAAEVSAQAAATADEHGFASVEEVRDTVLDPSRRAELTVALAERAETEARVAAVLRDAETAFPEDGSVEGVADGPATDVAAAEVASASAEGEAAAAARAFHTAEQDLVSLTALRARLAEELTAWEPVRVEAERADGMSKLVRGMGGDNHLQMRLSAYVLARRLDQVVDAANERLAQMRDQRYLLARTGRAARRVGQAGLGLEVLDQWTGDVREPATLSGGETFVVSLALALGLADVVTQEAGGTEIETLFVDEGFGTLDPDTLDDVMDRLDGLRAGGRTVGVVSHVAELRTRIPCQLHVRKTPAGSSVRAATRVG